MIALTPIPKEEAERLEECEATISKGLTHFVEVGKALIEVKEYRLYRATHATFAEYCRERWSMAKSQAYRVMEAAQIVGILPMKAGERAPLEGESSTDDLSPNGDTQESLPAPKSEGSIRPLTTLPKEEVASTYERAVEIAGGEAPTAAQTQQAVEEKRNELAQAMGFKTPEQANDALEDKPAAPAPPPSEGMRLARLAIKRLDEISKTDTQRDEAMDYVVAWIGRNR